MRDIKFKAKNSNGNWVFGDYAELAAYDDQLLPSIVDTGKVYAVDPSTVCQYTGRKDKNGTEVYEGDIVKIEHWTTLKVMTYIDRRMGFYPVDIKSGKAFDLNVSDSLYEVVGNIYENHELLGPKIENKACWC